MTISRRAVLKSMSLPLVLSPMLSVTGLARARGSERLTLGFVGVGIHGRGHLGQFLGNTGVQVVAVCDVDTTRREHALGMVKKAYGQACAGYVDYRELIAHKDLDAVLIATPDHWHALIALEAAKAKKHIYCEKPLTYTLLEGKRLIDAARENDIVFQTGSQQRTEYDQRFVKACEFVRAGRIGAVLQVAAGVPSPDPWGPSCKDCDLPEEAMEPGLEWDRWLGPAPVRPYNSILSPRGIHNHYPDWRYYREYSGGMMTDWGAHNFDIAQWALVMDESGPTKVVPPSDEKAMHGAKLVYGNGVELLHGGPNGVTFIGSRGTLFVGRDSLSSNPANLIAEPLSEAEAKFSLPRAANHHADWLDAIRLHGTAKSRRPICDVEVGARSAACCHLFNLAYRHRKAMVWNPATWEFEGDGAMNALRDCERRAGYTL